MVRYAAHRVYIQSESRLLIRQMVELDGRGIVVSVSPFSMEVHHTIWVDGIIVVLDFPPDSPYAGECLDAYLKRVCKKKETDHIALKEMRAYQIVGIDIPAMRFKSVGLVSLLK